MIELSYEEAGDITLRPVNFAAFASWLDTIARGNASDAGQNLAIDCASTPGPEGLAALFEDFGFLPEAIANELLACVGTPEGATGVGYPVVRLAAARAAHTRASELRARIAGMAPAADELEKKRAADLAYELEAYEVDLIPLELLDAAERVTRRALIFRTPAGLLAFRPPGRAAAADYVNGIAAFQSNKPDSSFALTGRALLVACAISPSAEAMIATLDTWPALVQWIPDVLREAASGGKARTRS